MEMLPHSPQLECKLATHFLSVQNGKSVLRLKAMLAFLHTLTQIAFITIEHFTGCISAQTITISIHARFLVQPKLYLTAMEKCIERLWEVSQSTSPDLYTTSKTSWLLSTKSKIDSETFNLLEPLSFSTKANSSPQVRMPFALL